MTNRYLIAFDLDGTLLNNEGIITMKTVGILKTLHENNHLLVIATGRPQSACKEIIQQIGIDEIPIVSFNGASIYCEKSSLNEQCSIDHNILNDIFNQIDIKQVNNILITDKNKIYKYTDHEYLPLLFKKSKLPLIDAKLTEIDRGLSLLINYKENQYSLFFELLMKYEDSLVIRKWPSPYNVIEVQKKGVTKAYGIERLRIEHKILKENVIAFGDEENDIPMLKYASIGVAMGNAEKKIKKIADYITLDNRNEGVYYYLKKKFKKF